MDSYEKLIKGYKEFHSQYIAEENKAWRSWAKVQQNPKVMIIGCSDSRVNPVIITHASLGDIFVVNNVANLVPPFKEGKDTHHSTSAAIEFGVNHLHIEHIIVMGHSGCGGIRALMEDHDGGESVEGEPSAEYSFIKPWMEIVGDAADFTDEEKKTHKIETLACICEKRASLISLNNLVGFPWVKRAMQENGLQIHAWHFDIGSGVLESYDHATGEFLKVD